MNNTAIETISNNVRNLAEATEFTSFLSFITQLAILMLIYFTIYYLIHIGNKYVENKHRLDLGKRQLYKFIFLFLGSLLLIVLFRIRGLLFSILAPFIFAIVVAYILNPPVQYLTRRGIKRVWGVLIVYLGISIALLIISLTLIPRITSEIMDFIEVLPKYSNEAYDYLYSLYLNYNRNIENLPAELEGVKDLLRLNIERIEVMIFGAFTSATNILIGMFSKVLGVVLIPILAFYFLKDVELFKKTAILLIPTKSRREVLKIAHDLDVVLAGFIRGQLTVAAFVGILTTIALLILRVEFAVLVGLIAGIANIIPYFGPVIGIVPGVLFALMDGPVKALWVIIIFTIIQQIESGIVAPKIVGKSVGIHPVVVILSLIVGGRFFGIIGLLIAVPAAATIKVLGKHLINYIAKI